jgi:hypothetical protein
MYSPGIRSSSCGCGLKSRGRHRDALHAPADRCIDTFVDDLMRGRSNGLQTRGAEAIDGSACDGWRKAGQHGRNARDVLTLWTVRLAAAENDVLYFVGVEVWRLGHNVPKAMCSEIFRTRQIERAPKGFGKCGPRTGNHNHFSHVLSSGQRMKLTLWAKTLRD